MIEEIVPFVVELAKKQYDEKDLPNFLERMCQSADHFRLATIYIDQFERVSDEYTTISEYHKHAMLNEKYKEIYHTVAMLGETDGGHKFFEYELLGKYQIGKDTP